MDIRTLLEDFPFIAITRGIHPQEAIPVSTALYDAGFRIIENPLNSPTPLDSINKMAKAFDGKALIGAGTVTGTEQVKQVKKAGGKIIISPNCNLEVIRATKDAGLLSIPGVATPSEAFAALEEGADALKLFPAEMIPPAVVKALRAVLPHKTLLLPVGGVISTNWQSYMQAGAGGFGLGSSLYKAGISPEEISEKSREFLKSWRGYLSTQ